jgi:hypothetical protein
MITVDSVGATVSMLRQHCADCRAPADDLLKTPFASDLVFEVQFFSRKPVFQLLDLAISERILKGNSDLAHTTDEEL